MFRSLEVLKDASTSTQCLQDSATKSSGACQTRGSGTAYRHRMFQRKGQLMDVPYLSCNYPIRRRISCSTRETTRLCCNRTPTVLSQDFPCNPVPQIYKGGQGLPPNNHQHLRQYKPKRTQGSIQTRSPNLSKSLCSLYHRVLEQSIPTYKPYC